MRVNYYEFDPIPYIKSLDWIKKGMPQLNIDKELEIIQDQKREEQQSNDDRAAWKNSKALEKKLQDMSKFNKVMSVDNSDITFNVIWDPIIQQLILLSISGELDTVRQGQDNDDIEITIPSFIDTIQTISCLVQTSRAQKIIIEQIQPLQMTGLYNRLSNESDALKRQFSARGQYVGTLDLQNLELKNLEISNIDKDLLKQIDEICKNHKMFGIMEITQTDILGYYKEASRDVQYVHPIFDNSILQAGCFGDKLIVQETTTKGLTSVTRLFKHVDYQEIDCTDMTLKHLQSLAFLFCGCDKVKTIKIHELYTQNKTSMAQMFSDCRSLTQIEWLDKFRYDSVETTEGMFYGCMSIEELDLGGTQMPHNKNMSAMFQMCKGLEKLALNNIKIADNCDMQSMLFNCNNLHKLYLDHINQEIQATEPLLVSRSYDMYGNPDVGLWAIDVQGSQAQIQHLVLRTLERLGYNQASINEILKM